MTITSQGRLLQKGTDAMSDVHPLICINMACRDDPNTKGWLRAERRGVDYNSGSSLIHALNSKISAEFPGAVSSKIVASDVALEYAKNTSGHIVIVNRSGYRWVTNEDWLPKGSL